jgi:hypothetical protein
MRSSLLIAAPLFFAALDQAQHAPAPRVELLWPNGAPGALGNDDTDKPNLTIYLPRSNDEHSGVVVCPGGGYQMLAVDHEGKQIAEWLNARGVAAFVLRYRLGPRYHHPIELGDAQRALRLVRFHAADYGVEPGRIGIWGFSAGGHLASTTGTHFDAGEAGAADPIDRMGSRPDFMILSYPVISFITPYVHRGSMRNLLGENPDPKLAASLSTRRRSPPNAAHDSVPHQRRYRCSPRTAYFLHGAAQSRCPGGDAYLRARRTWRRTRAGGSYPVFLAGTSGSLDETPWVDAMKIDPPRASSSRSA